MFLAGTAPHHLVDLGGKVVSKQEKGTTIDQGGQFLLVEAWQGLHFVYDVIN